MPTVDTAKVVKLPTSSEADAALVPMVVARGRTVQHGGEIHGVGTTLYLPVGEAAHLADAGFVHVPELLGVVPAAVPVRSAGPTINGDDGNMHRVR